MFNRSRQQFVSWIALLALIVVAFSPTSYAAGAGYDGLGGICSVGGVVQGDPALPAGGGGVSGHCAFCVLGAPLVAAEPLLQIVARLSLPHAVMPLQRHDALPPDTVAIHPLSPRAPPRAI